MHIRDYIDFNSFGAKVDFSRRQRKAPKSTIVTILIENFL